MSRAVETVVRRIVRAADAVVHRVYGWRWNPLHQSGALAAWLLVVLTITGLYLLLVYRVGDPSASVQRLAADPWLGRWIRTLHRYSTDLFILATLAHALRILGQSRGWGPRRRAWLSGLFLLGVGLLCAWTGFVMAWDTFGQRLAVEGARLIDALPILSEPVGRLFAGDRSIPSAFFFLNLFVHIALPLAMLGGLWFHVARVARPVLAPPRALRWAITGGLGVLSIAWPAALGPAADARALPGETPIDLITAWWLPLSERAPASTVWLTVLVVAAGAIAVPWLVARPREGSWAVSVVDPRLCTGCNQCPQDCPWEAITMVPRTDDRPTLVALVDPSKCVSCGICAGSCAPMGVGPPGRTGRDQIAIVRSTVDSSRGRSASPIVAVSCAQLAPTVRTALMARGAHIHDVPCVGGLHSSVVELFIRHGHPGVMILGCPPRDCIGREGPKWLEQRLFHEREAELQARVDRRRVCVATAALGLDHEVLAAFDDFAASVRRLDAPAAELIIELEAECEAVLDGGVR